MAVAIKLHQLDNGSVGGRKRKKSLECLIPRTTVGSDDDVVWLGGVEFQRPRPILRQAPVMRTIVGAMIGFCCDVCEVFIILADDC